MSIVNITRLQVRRGDRADLPRLASAELGWAIDTQQLFIGNGALAENAPEEGNTEILTEKSNVLGGFSQYSYQGNSGGVDIDTQVTRSLQDRLDDYVSVRAWGADGNGVDSRSAINRALRDLFSNQGDQQTRVGLYLPAGVYIISGALELPPNTYIFGDGMGNTIIRCGGLGAAIRTVDSDLNYGGDMGTNLDPSLGESLPKNIVIRDLTIQHTQDQNLTELRSVTNIILDRVEFLGVYSDLTGTAYSTQTGLSFLSLNDAVASGGVKLTGCRFRNLGVGIRQNQLLNGMSLDYCSFDTCYNGVVMGDPAISAGSAPKAAVIQHCQFNRIAREAVVASRGAKFVSMSNFYTDVGNRGGASPIDPVLISNAPGCSSWMDQFDRPADANIERFSAGNDSYLDSTKVGTLTRYYGDPEDRIIWGLKRTLRTHRYELVGNSNGTLPEIEVRPGTGYNGNTLMQEVRYAVTRDFGVRTGTLKFTVSAGDISVNESYDYVSDDCGISFFSALVNGVVVLNYSLSPGSDATLIVTAEQLVDE